MVKFLGTCYFCKDGVYRVRMRDMFGKLVPSWVVSNNNIFHKHFFKEYSKSCKKTKFTYETPQTPLGKLTIEKDM